MANAQFCPLCGDIISDGCDDEFGHQNYSPCKCELTDGLQWVEDATFTQAVLQLQTLTDMNRFGFNCEGDAINLDKANVNLVEDSRPDYTVRVYYNDTVYPNLGDWVLSLRVVRGNDELLVVSEHSLPACIEDLQHPDKGWWDKSYIFAIQDTEKVIKELRNYLFHEVIKHPFDTGPTGHRQRSVI